MYNLVHFFIGFLAELGFITPEGAKAVDRELSPQIIASNSQDAFEQVHQAMVKVSKDLNLRGDLVKIEPWLSEIRLLESRVKELESSHNGLIKEVERLVKATEKKVVAKAKV